MSSTKLIIGRLEPMFRKTNFIKNKKLSRNLDKNFHEINLNHLTEPQIEIITTVYNTFLKQNFLKLNKVNRVRRRAPRKKKLVQKATLVSSENSSASPTNSLDDFNDNLIKAKKLSLSETSSCGIRDLDRFSSVISDIKMSKNNKKKPKMSEQELEELYSKNIEPIQKDIMPRWSTINSEEKTGICDLLDRWQASLANIYARSKKKPSQNVILNEEKLANCGKFDFEKNNFYLKKTQLELHDLSTVKTPDGNKILPNTRLLLRSYMQFIHAFGFLKEARQNLLDSDPNQNKLYWKQMNKFLICVNRGIFRCLFYVHENASLHKASIGLPPIFFLESDEIYNEIPTIKMESLAEYAYLCSSRQDINIKLQEEHKHDNLRRTSEIIINTNSTFKLKKYKLILNCLIRLIQVASMIRDDILMKQFRYNKTLNENQIVDVDLYAHFISSNINLIREYLLEILRD